MPDRHYAMHVGTKYAQKVTGNYTSWIGYLCTIALLILAANLNETASAQDQPDDYRFPSPRVLLVGVEGLELESVTPTNTPHLNIMLESGKLATFRAIKASPSSASGNASTDAWARVLTDVGIALSDEEALERAIPRPRHLFDRIRNLKPDTFISLFTPSIDLLHWVNNRANAQEHVPIDMDNPFISLLEMVTSANEVLRSSNPDLVFVHLPASPNGSMDSQRSITTLQHDRLVGMLLETVVNRPAYANEDWLILVVNPGIPENSQNTTAFMIAAGRSVHHERTITAAGFTDLPPTILRHMELLALEPGIYSGQPIPIFSNDSELRDRRMLMPILNSIRNLQAENESTARKLELMQKEAEARLRVHDEELLNKTAASFNTSVERIREATALGTVQALEAIQDAHKTLITVILALFAVGLFGGIYIMWIQFRSVKNMSSIITLMNSRSLPEFSENYQPHSRLEPSPQGAHLLDAIQRLESRIDSIQSPTSEPSSTDTFVETKSLGQRRTHRRFGGN